MIKFAYYFGIGVQGVVLGILLFQAFMYLAGTMSEAKVFQYQGF